MVLKKSPVALNEAIKVLQAGGVVVCPTDTVYGFLALAENKKAVEKIYKIKKRPKKKPLAVFVKDFKMAESLAEINESQKKILKQKWPGKYTFILPYKLNKTIALRIPKYKFLNDLLKKINKPLAQTSVNISGNPPILAIGDIIERFGKQNILIIDGGNLKKSSPSRIIDLTSKDLTTIR